MTRCAAGSRMRLWQRG